jgi:hypothetical protein
MHMVTENCLTVHSRRQRSPLADLGDAFAALRRIVGSEGKFHVVLEVADLERFRALGKHQKEVPAGDGGTTLVRSMELEGASLTALARRSRRAVRR